MNTLEKKITDKKELLTDEEIILHVKSGKKEYYSEIVRRYNQRLYRIALSYGISDDDAEEVIQIAYIAAFEKLHQFRGDARFSTWLVRILINECLLLKRKKKKIINVSEEEIVTIPSDSHLNPQEEVMNKERKEILENAVSQLPEKLKSVYILKEIEGMSIEETAETLNLSKINVKVRLHRARTLLKNLISNVIDASSLFTFGNERCDRINKSVMEYIRNTPK